MIEDTVILTGGIVEVQESDHNIALFFDYIDDESCTVEAAITDNFVETNYALQDHIAIKPKIYRLRGCVGELVYKNKFDWTSLLNNKINNKKSNNPILNKTIEAQKAINIVSPIVSNYTRLAIDAVNQIESSYNRYLKMHDVFKNINEFRNIRQQSVVSYLNQLLQQRRPVKLKNLKFEATFEEGQYESLYFLQSVGAHQGPNDFISDIEVTIKEFRIATTKTTQLDKNKYGAITASMVQKQPEVNEGIGNTESIPKAYGDQLKDKVKEAVKDKPFLYNVCKTVGNFIENLGKTELSRSGQYTIGK